MTTKLDNRIDEINSLIFDIAAGNFHSKGIINGDRGELDAVITGINMLAEELEKNTVSIDNLKKVFEGIPDMVFILNNNGQIVYINSKVSSDAGYKLEMLKGHTFNVLFPLNHKIKFNELRTYLQNNPQKQDLNTRFITVDKSIIPVSCSFSFIKGYTTKDNRILMIVKDLSEVQIIKKELQDRNKELNTFIYRASHDLRGPLATIKGLFNLIDLGQNDAQELKNYLKLIKESSKKLYSVVDELLDLGRITASGINYQEIRIVEIINAIVEEHSDSPAFKRTSFEIIDTQDYLLTSEPQILKSILYSLIDNSIKYCHPQIAPHIKLEIMDSSRGIKINICDNGIGIPNNIRNKIFEMFYRGNHLSNGSGLGLYIVKTGVEKLGGKIWLRSTLDKGSTFSIYLPHQHKHLK